MDGIGSGMEMAIQPLTIVDIRPAGYEEKRGTSVFNCPKPEQTTEMVQRAIKQDGRNLQYCSVRHLTKELCLQAVSSCGEMIKCVPKKLLDEEMCLVAIANSPLAITRIPEAMRTRRIWLAATQLYPDSFSSVPEEQRDEELVLTMVGSHGRALRYVPEGQKTNSVIWAAVENDGRALEFVPKDFVTYDLCLAAVKSNPSAIEFVPSRLANDELRLLALESDPMTVRWMPRQLLTHERCVKAASRDWKCLSRLPEDLIDEEVCRIAMGAGWRAASVIPESMLTVCDIRESLCAAVEELESLPEISTDDLDDKKSFLDAYREKCDVVKEIRDCTKSICLKKRTACSEEHELIRLQRSLGIRKVIDGRYNLATGRYVVKEEVDWLPVDPKMDEKGRCIIREFDEYGDMARWLDDDLSMIDLSEVPRGGDALCPLYELAVSMAAAAPYGHSRALFRMPSEICGISPEAEAPVFDYESERRISYVTDVHLESCIKNKFPCGASDREVTEYVWSLARQIVKSRNREIYGDYPYLANGLTEPEKRARLESGAWGTLLIGGDTCHSLRLARIFYKELARLWKPSDIVVVLGNHELWERPLELVGEPAVDAVVAAYRSLFDELGITFLHNSVAFVSGNWEKQKYELRDYSYVMDEDNATALMQLSDSCPVVILGGTGFSGLSPAINASHGVYGEALTTLDEDVTQTERFRRLHDRLASLVPKKNVIVLTHMPYWQWTDAGMTAGWAYVSGHTHQNVIEVGPEREFYANNQIGYKRKTVDIKSFVTTGRYDIFYRLDDGVYQITRKQYESFNRGLGIGCEINRSGDILMLKRQGYYLFLFVAKGKTYLLEGGRIHNVSHTDPAYYYGRMRVYAEATKKALASYRERILQVAGAVKAFGGEGRVHGTIVDIDFMCHIYVNPFDGTLTPYYAESTVDKTVYPNVMALLEERSHYLLKGFAENGSKLLDLEVGAESSDELNEAVRVFDTTIYGPSRIMRSIQYMFDANVIRVWNDEVVDKALEALEGRSAGDGVAGLPWFEAELQQR